MYRPTNDNDAMMSMTTNRTIHYYETQTAQLIISLGTVAILIWSTIA